MRSTRRPCEARVVALTGDLARPAAAGKSVRAWTTLHVVEQRGDDFSARLANAIVDAAAAAGARPVLLIASDTPQVTAGLLTECAEALLETDVVFGLARDGGWWVLGVTDPAMADCLNTDSDVALGYRSRNAGSVARQGFSREAGGRAVGRRHRRRRGTRPGRMRTRQPVRPRDQGCGALTCWAISTTGRWTASGAGSATTTVGCVSCRCAAGWAVSTPTALSTTRCSGSVSGPTIDLGCGPGRLVARLVERGVPALGVDQSATAVGLARRSGAPALLRDVFEPLPGTGRWQTVLLADGNVGLGGDPWRVLRRAGELLRRGGSCIVEFDSASTGVDAGWVRLESSRTIGPWFRWASVGIDCAARLAEDVGMALTGIHPIGNRVVASLASA